MKKLLSLLVLTSLSTLSFAATITSMNSAQTKAALSDKTVKTLAAATLDGKLIENSFIGYFSPDGKIKGSFANKPDNQPQTDTGVWSVKTNGDFCFTWDHWDNHQEQCVTFYNLNNAILAVNKSHKFETIVLNSNIQPGDQTGSMMNMQTSTPSTSTNSTMTPAPAAPITPTDPNTPSTD